MYVFKLTFSYIKVLYIIVVLACVHTCMSVYTHIMMIKLMSFLVLIIELINAYNADQHTEMPLHYYTAFTVQVST